MLITDENKSMILGKFNSPNLDQVLIIDLINYDSNYKFIFTVNVFGNIYTEKIEIFVEKALDEIQNGKKKLQEIL